MYVLYSDFGWHLFEGLTGPFYKAKEETDFTCFAKVSVRRP